MAGFKVVMKNGVPQYWKDKSVDARLDYGVRMYRWLLPGDTIDTDIPPVWETSAGLVVVDEGVSLDKLTSFVLLEGGVLGSIEWARCVWWTTQGRREVQTLWFRMVPK